MSGTSEPRRDPRRTGVVVGAVLGLVLLVLVVWLVARAVTGDDGDGGADSASGGPSGSGSTQPSSPFPSTSVGADGSPLPSKAPGQTAPTEVVATPGETVTPVRARLDSPADLGDGVVARVTEVEAVKGKARGPGEVSGPSLRFTVEVRNGSSKPLRTIASGLTAFYGPQARPAIDLSGPGVVVMPNEIAPGDVGRGRYVFLIPEGARDQLRLDFSYSVAVPKVVFVGGR